MFKLDIIVYTLILFIGLYSVVDRICSMIEYGERLKFLQGVERRNENGESTEASSETSEQSQ